jgi:hypothetical protein
MWKLGEALLGLSPGPEGAEDPSVGSQRAVILTF